MAEEINQENNAPDENKKYTSVIIALLVVLGILSYFIFAPDKTAQEETTNGNTIEEISQKDETPTYEYEEEEVVLGESTEPDPSPDPEPADEEEVGPEEEEEVKLADIYIKDFSFEDDPKQNEQTTVEIEIGNKGDAIARDVEWEWWATEDDLGCNDDINTLEPDETDSIECEYTYTGSDEYETKVIVDVDDDIEESDEDNNEYTGEVTPEEELKADLTISEYSFDPVPEKQVPFTVRIGIKNEGNKVAEDFYWEWWPTAHSHACREHISEIAPNSTKVVTCDYEYGGWSTYPTKAVADADDTIDEFDEDNNEYTEEVVPIH